MTRCDSPSTPSTPPLAPLTFPLFEFPFFARGRVRAWEAPWDRRVVKSCTPPNTKEVKGKGGGAVCRSATSRRTVTRGLRGAHGHNKRPTGRCNALFLVLSVGFPPYWSNAQSTPPKGKGDGAVHDSTTRLSHGASQAPYSPPARKWKI